MDQAIVIVAQDASSAVEVKVGFSPTVTDRTDYQDGIGHLIEMAKDIVGWTIGLIYSSP